MRSHIPAIVRAFDAAIWAIDREKYDAIREFIVLRAARRPTDQFQAAARPMAKVSGRIAVLPLNGCIAHHAGMEMEISGGTSTSAFGKSFDDAVANKDIGAIVIDCDSPGGTVEGVPELAAKIFNARGTKPIYAVANANMNSAAYWIASAADQIIATPSANVGSIGVFSIYTDTSKLDADLGISYDVISAGRYKEEAAGVGPLTDPAREALQHRVDECYEMFSGAVAKHRGASIKNVTSGFGEGRSISAKDALAAGMIDRIASFDDVITDLAGRSAPNGVARLAASGGLAAVVAQGRASMAAFSRHIRSAAFASPELLAFAAVTCPVCGATLDDDGECPNGDYEQPEVPARDEGTTEASERRGAPVVVANPPAPIEPAPQARSLSVTPEELAAQRAAETAATAHAKAAIEAERARARDINAMCAQESIPNDQRDAWLASDIGVDAVSTAILRSKRTETAALPTIRVGANRELEKPFASLGDQLVAIVQHGLITAGDPRGRRDPRLAYLNSQILAGTPSGMNESIGSEGGFFIQPSLLPGIIDPVYTDDPILSRVTRIPIGANSNSVTLNVVDETARTTGNRWGGIQMYWLAEADQKIPSKPKMRQVTLNLKKLAGLAYLTDELMQDAPAAESLLTRAFQAELSFMLAIAFWNGSGAGQPMGMLKAGALVTQAIEGSQTIANTPASIALNTSKMLSRIPAALWNDVIWLYNQELLPYLATATLGTSSVPVFLGQGGISGKTYDTIWGRPAYPSEMAEAVGTPGDIVAAVPSQYLVADKGGPQQATSIHVRFIYDEQVLRIVYRTDGQPLWITSVTPFKGANARSPFVVLNTRT